MTADAIDPQLRTLRGSFCLRHTGNAIDASDAQYLTCPGTDHPDGRTGGAGRKFAATVQLQSDGQQVWGHHPHVCGQRFPLGADIITPEIFDRLYNRAENDFDYRSSGAARRLQFEVCMQAERGPTDHLYTVGRIRQNILHWSWDSCDGTGPRWSVECPECHARRDWVIDFDGHTTRMWCGCGHTWLENFAQDELDYFFLSIKDAITVRGQEQAGLTALTLRSVGAGLAEPA